MSEPSPQDADRAQAEPTPDEPGARRSQAPDNLPPQLQNPHAKHEGAVASRPGFRNPTNKRSKKQKKRKR
ncbi:MAG: hypothetical protein EA397_06260 [Deltaproteobacteria bacterium]|nr:MAG: hypothetical protein EA397_06260 [Deltaproteobacteria bacterium]